MDTFTDYRDAYAEAIRRTRDGNLDVAIRKCREYGRTVFVVRYASRNDSDYATAEIVKAGTRA